MSIIKNMIITQAGIAEVINAEQSGTDVVILTHIAFGTGQYTATTDRTELAEEFKRFDAIAGGYIGDDTIHLTINDSSQDEYTVYEVGVFTSTGTLFAVCSQTTPIIQKVAATEILLACDVLLTNGISPESITVGDTNFVLNPATTERAGIAELATEAETVAGTDDQRTVTPKGLKAKLDSIDGNYVHKAGEETITGTKTFSASPKVPTAADGTNDTTAASTAFVNKAVENATAGDNAVVHIAGEETITGVKTFELNTFSLGIGGFFADTETDWGASFYCPSISLTNDDYPKVPCRLYMKRGDVIFDKYVSFNVLPLGTKTALGADAYGLHVSADGGLQLFGTHFLQGDIWSDDSLKMVKSNVSLYSTDTASIGFDYANEVTFRTMPNDGNEATYKLEAWEWTDDSHTAKAATAGVKLLKPSQATELVPTSVLNRQEGDARWLRKSFSYYGRDYFYDETGNVVGSIGLADNGLNICFDSDQVDSPNPSQSITLDYNGNLAFLTNYGFVSVPNKSGTIALTSDIPDVSGFLEGILDDDGYFRPTRAVKASSFILATGAVYIGDEEYEIKFPTKSGTVALTGDLLGYLPLTGGALTTEAGISRNDDTSFLGLYGGSTSTGGAKLELCGKENETYQGEFRLYATDDSNNIVLRGKPDGTLLWNNKDIITSSGGVMTVGNILFRDVDTGYLSIFGGKTSTSGASLALYGQDNTSNPGEFYLYARSSSGDIKYLRGKPDGTLKWNAKTVVTSDTEGLTIKTMTQTEYDALTTKDAATLYVITEE